jgi:hypothetical protein
MLKSGRTALRRATTHSPAALRLQPRGRGSYEITSIAWTGAWVVPDRLARQCKITMMPPREGAWAPTTGTMHICDPEDLDVVFTGQPRILLLTRPAA